MHRFTQRILLSVLATLLQMVDGAVLGIRGVAAKPLNLSFERIEERVTLPPNMLGVEQLVNAYFEPCEDLAPLDAEASQTPYEDDVHGNEFESQRCLKRRTALRKTVGGMVVKTVSRPEALVVHGYDFKRKGFPMTFRGELGWFGTNCSKWRYDNCHRQYITHGMPTHVDSRFVVDDSPIIIASAKDVFARVVGEQDAERIRVVQTLVVEAIVRLDKSWQRWDESWRSPPRRLMTKPSNVVEADSLIGFSATVLAFRIVDMDTGRILYSEPESERDVISKADQRQAESSVPEDYPPADSVPLTELRASDLSADATQPTDAMWLKDSEVQSALMKIGSVKSAELEKGVSEQLKAAPPWAVRPDQIPPPTRSKRARCYQPEPYYLGWSTTRIDTGGGAGVSANLGKKAAAKMDGSVKPGPEASQRFCKWDNIFSVVQQRAGVMRACYERELRLQPGLQGKVTLKWKIDLDGAVEKATTVDSSMGSRAVDDCLVKTVCGMRFAKPDGGSCIVQWPFVFSDTPE